MTYPNLLKACHIPIVYTDVPPFKSCGVEKSLDEASVIASSIKSIVMSGQDIEADMEEIEELIATAETRMEVN